MQVRRQDVISTDEPDRQRWAEWLLGSTSLTVKIF